MLFGIGKVLSISESNKDKFQFIEQINTAADPMTGGCFHALYFPVMRCAKPTIPHRNKSNDVNIVPSLIRRALLIFQGMSNYDTGIGKARGFIRRKRCVLGREALFLDSSTLSVYNSVRHT